MKPTQEEINQYCSLLEDYLAAQKWKIELTTSDLPLNDNGEEWWFDDVRVTLPDGKIIQIFACFAGLTVIHAGPNQLFNDACQLQNAVYAQLKIHPNHPNDLLDDPYWKLWEKIN